MELFVGMIILLFSGLCQGSFGLGQKKYNPLSWEAFWCTFSFWCLFVTTVWTFIVQPNFIGIYKQDTLSAFLIPMICGALWGASTIAFSKSILMVGLSLCGGINMGVSAVVGGLVPFFTSGKELKTKSVVLLLVGTVLTVLGIAIITKAGLIKEKNQTPDQAGNTKNVSLTKVGIILAIISGTCSGAMNVGFAKAGVYAPHAKNTVSASAVQWYPVLFGGLLVAIIICICIMFAKKTFSSFKNSGSVRRIGILFVTSLVWFAALTLYGIASKRLGEYGSTIGWIVYNAIALIVTNFWGIITGEWKGETISKRWLFIGDAVLVISWIFIAIV